MNWVESKYINLVSNQLQNYKKKSSDLYNFACAFCGDGESKRKARGYLYNRGGKFQYHCHNCGITYNFSNFLKKIDYNLYCEYSLERLKDSRTTEQITKDAFEVKMKAPVFLKSGPLSKLKKISQLKADHPAKVFVDKRLIPPDTHHKLFYCPKFFAWTNSIIPNKFEEKVLQYDEPRLLIPFLTVNQELHAFQGRSFDPNAGKMKYITIVNNPDIPKIYGLDDVNLNKKTYVFEGPLDSLFIKNSIATAGGDLISTVKDYPKQNIVVVYDNERRSKETLKKIDNAITAGYSICIWPDNFTAKDINDAILDGMSSDHIKYIIDKNTYSGLQAKLRLNMWSRI